MRRVVGIERGGGQDLAQEHERSAPGVDQHGVLAHEPQPGLLGVAPLEDRPGIHVHAAGDFVTGPVAQPVGEAFQARRHNRVVVRAPGIVRDAPAPGIAQHGLGDGVGPVIQRDDHQRLNPRQDGVQIAAARFAIGASQIAHRAMHPGLDPAQVGVQRGRWCGPDGARLGEAQRRRTRPDLVHREDHAGPPGCPSASAASRSAARAGPPSPANAFASRSAAVSTSGVVVTACTAGLSWP